MKILVSYLRSAIQASLFITSVLLAFYPETRSEGLVLVFRVLWVVVVGDLFFRGWRAGMYGLSMSGLHQAVKERRATAPSLLEFCALLMTAIATVRLSLT